MNTFENIFFVATNQFTPTSICLLFTNHFAVEVMHAVTLLQLNFRFKGGDQHFLLE